MIKCRISPYNDKIFIDDTTSSKLNYMKEGYFITKEELEQLQREAFDAGRYGRYTRNSILPMPLLWSEIQHDFDYKDFDDYLLSRSKEGK